MVELDVSRPVPEAISVGIQGKKIKIVVQRDALPSYCLHCCKLGHSFDMYFVKYPHLKPGNGGGQSHGVFENAGYKHNKSNKNSPKRKDTSDWQPWEENNNPREGKIGLLGIWKAIMIGLVGHLGSPLQKTLVLKVIHLIRSMIWGYKNSFDAYPISLKMEKLLIWLVHRKGPFFSPPNLKWCLKPNP